LQRTTQQQQQRERERELIFARPARRSETFSAAAAAAIGQACQRILKAERMSSKKRTRQEQEEEEEEEEVEEEEEEDGEGGEDDEEEERGGGRKSTKASTKKKPLIKAKSAHVLRKEATEKSARIKHMRKTHESEEALELDAPRFYRSVPVGVALFSALQSLISENVLEVDAANKILENFDSAFADAIGNAESILPKERRDVHCSEVEIKGKLSCYNNLRTHWKIDATEVTFGSEFHVKQLERVRFLFTRED